MSWYGWRPYVSAAARRVRAMKEMERLRKKGLDIRPVRIEGRKIAGTFWGKAWCDHLESFSDYENRLPRGRTYVRNGSVCHLDVARGEVNAIVSGSDLYKVRVKIRPLSPEKWKAVKERCAGQIGSLLELLQGRLSGNVMTVVTDRDNGLFPLPGEISMKCSCPDWAVMCKHVAAVLYGVGARLDERPELLFLLRGVDHEELISAEVGVTAGAARTKGDRRRIADAALADVFGIEMPEDVKSAEAMPSPRREEPVPESKKASKTAAKLTDKRETETGRRTTHACRTSAGSGKTSRAASNVRPVTGSAVAGLRAKFGMSRAEFAGLLGVSAPSVANWEKKPGPLDLQTRTLDAWDAATGLTKRQAWRKLKGA